MIREFFRSLALAALLTGAANTGFSQAAANDQLVDAKPALDAITLLGRFPAEVERITTEISRVPLPEGHVSYTCVYIFWGAKTVNYESSLSFSDLQPTLRSKIQTVQTSTKKFADRFTPMLRKWAQTSLPQSSAAFTDASAEVEAVQNEIKRGTGPNDPQRTRVIASLDRILESLGSGKAELTTMTGVLAQYLQEQRAARGSWSQWSTDATRQVQSYDQKIRQDIGWQRCQGDGLQKLDTVVRNANASISTIKNKIGEMDECDNNADKALSIMLGAFVGYASRYETVSGRLKTVKEAPLGSTLQGLHLAIATRTWQDMVGAAKQSGL